MFAFPKKEQPVDMIECTGVEYDMYDGHLRLRQSRKTYIDI